MTDWEKFKVTELKEECKSRKISITGLKLKQHFIDKLSEYESSNSESAAQAEETVAEKTNGAIDEVAEGEVLPDQNEELQHHESVEQARTEDPIEDIPLAVETDKNLPTERPAALKIEDSQVSAAEADAADTPVAENTEEAKEIEKHDMLVPDAEQMDIDENAPPTEQDKKHVAEENTAELKLKEAIQEPKPTEIIDNVDRQNDSTGSTPNEEVRKRKRRSVTPPPDAEEVAKKAKAVDGTSIVTKRASKPSISKSPSPRHDSVSDVTSKQISSDEPKPTNETSRAREGSEETPADRQRSLSVDKDDIVEPAVHAATRSLYMQNFKRPLNIQVLRSHIMTIAQGSSSVVPGQDPIKFYNVNNIRSHAFVTFSSIAAASRVRAAMHKTRFPDEPQREPLWVDFVPDDKVEKWVDQETSGSRGMGRNSSSKLEVVYQDTGEGVEAVFREVGSSYPQRPSIGAVSNNRSSISLRQASYSADPSRTSVVASGIHPDRAGLLPHSPKDQRRPSSPSVPTPRKKHEDQGIGFKGLDDLFSSTVTKPKLYYKLPLQSVIDERLSMIKDLYPDRGVTGDPGMKRYTFETENGREEWADSGPEFGHGKKGQDRLVGAAGRGRGGYRGRGGRAGYFGGDSYRGGGRR